jgi:hypothetical protein
MSNDNTNPHSKKKTSYLQQEQLMDRMDTISKELGVPRSWIHRKGDLEITKVLEQQIANKQINRYSCLV